MGLQCRKKSKLLKKQSWEFWGGNKKKAERYLESFEEPLTMNK